MYLSTFNGFDNGLKDISIAFPPGVVNRLSHVLVTISEVTQTSITGEWDTPVLEGATMTVHNICPHDNDTLTVRINIEWSSPLNYRLWISVLS